MNISVTFIGQSHVLEKRKKKRGNRSGFSNGSSVVVVGGGGGNVVWIGINEKHAVEKGSLVLATLNNCEKTDSDGPLH